MISKAFQLSIELEIHAITCPGVWLCPNNGDLSLSVFMLNSYGQTSYFYPIFPLLIHEKFQFNKVIQTAKSLGDLQNALNHEFFYCELVQWSLDCQNVGSVLANFQTCLADLLYPSFYSGKKVAGVDVELLMEASKSFPGIIAPKIEVSTKTTVKEITTCKKPKSNCTTYVTNPKTIRSFKTCYKRSPKITQKSVCHTDFYNCNKSCGNVNVKRSCRKCNCITPLIVQTESYCTPCTQHCTIDNNIDCQTRLRSGQTELNVQESSSINKLKSEKIPCNCLKNHTSSEQTCHGKQFCSESCHICRKYQEYFNKFNECMNKNRCKLSGESCSTSVDECRTCSTHESTPIDGDYVDSAHRVHKKVSSILKTSPDNSKIYQDCNFNEARKYYNYPNNRLSSGSDNKNLTDLKLKLDIKRQENKSNLNSKINEVQKPDKFNEKQTNDNKYIKKIEIIKKKDIKTRPNSSITSDEYIKKTQKLLSCSPEKKYKIMFYDNLEAFYKNLYEKVREKANKEREILN